MGSEMCIRDSLKFVEFDLIANELMDLCSLSTIQLNHPGGAAGYIIEKENKKVCVFLDHEYGQEPTIDNELLLIARESDLVIWDGMFLNEELAPKKGWGHSSIEQGIIFSEKTACKNLAIAHHAPNRNDQQLNEHSNNLSSDKVFFAYQGLSHSV